jgi:hypothetical protein
MDEQDLKERIMEKQKDRRIPCMAAFQIAKETGASLQEIGRLLDEMKIKIYSCQLGCF